VIDATSTVDTVAVEEVLTSALSILVEMVEIELESTSSDMGDGDSDSEIGWPFIVRKQSEGTDSDSICAYEIAQIKVCSATLRSCAAACITELYFVNRQHDWLPRLQPASANLEPPKYASQFPEWFL